MMGRLDDRQQPLFYDFCLEDHVPDNHLLRQVAKVLDLSGVRRKLAPYYSDMGRPSLDPELMIRMLLLAISTASARSGAWSRKYISIWPTAGSAGLASRARFPNAPVSPRRDMGDSARAMPSVWCSRACCKPAFAPVSSAARRSPRMRASSRPTRA